MKPIVDSERGEVEVTAAAAEEIEIVDATYVVVAPSGRRFGERWSRTTRCTRRRRRRR